ncbi:hypothetical protein MMC07_004123 [Pseudocyphellaria aurata]|nr:hypothetical protein [Pseudocyphellaria aurata]
MKSLLGLPWVVAAVTAQYIIDSSSFGHGPSLSPNAEQIPGWHSFGEGYLPQLYSDKVALTPPYPGNRRGAVWAVAKVSQSEWTAEINFRATGPERGGGNMQIWYTRDGEAQIGTSSIYTVGKFDGLVLVVDMYGGKGGSIRGFMNDGSTDYGNHHSVDSLAFGHCDYAYRNLGRPSIIQIKQEAHSFEVIVDHRQCFFSDKIKLPSEYSFGISAASAETADSFEAYKFVLTTSSSTTREEPRRDRGPPPSSPPQNSLPTLEDALASSFESQEARFADLHNRLQVIAHAADHIYGELTKLAEKSEGRHQELARNALSTDKLNAMDQRIQNVENLVRDYQGQLSNLDRLLKESHSRLTVGLPQHMSEIISTRSPRMGVFLTIFIVFQLLLAASYVVYKRRRANGPKKYL